MADRLRCLVVDDDPGDIVLLRRYLADVTEGTAEVLTFTEPEAALASLPSREVDLIFVDCMWATGRDSRSSARSKAPVAAAPSSC